MMACGWLSMHKPAPTEVGCKTPVDFLGAEMGPSCTAKSSAIVVSLLPNKLFSRLFFNKFFYIKSLEIYCRERWYWCWEFINKGNYFHSDWHFLCHCPLKCHFLATGLSVLPSVSIFFSHFMVRLAAVVIDPFNSFSIRKEPMILWAIILYM